MYIVKICTSIHVSFVCMYLYNNHTLCSYKILNPAGVDKESDPKKCAQAILDSTGLDADTYRLGLTKACLFFVVLY